MIINHTPTVEELMSLPKDKLAALRRRVEDVGRKNANLCVSLIQLAITTGSIKSKDILEA